MSLIDNAHAFGTGPRWLKALFWGAEGVGKTVTALALAKKFNLQLLGLDCDGGLSAYQHDPFWPKELFEFIATEDPNVVKKVTDELLENPREYGMFLIDPISTVYMTTQLGADQQGRRRNQTIEDYSPGISKGAWGPIKLKAFAIDRNIRRLGCTVVVTAREANLWANDQVIGLKPLAVGGIGHEFDLVIHMRQNQTGNRSAVVTKDRLNKMPKRMEGSPEDVFFVAREIAKTYDYLLTANTEAHPRADVEMVKLLHRQATLLNLNGAALAIRLRDKFGVDTFEDLRPEQADELLATMTPAEET